MKIVLQEKDRYFLRFETGDEVISMLADFCSKEAITAAYFTVIGACSEVTLSYYDLENKKYEDHEFKTDMEITSVTGNVGRLNNAVAIHAHGVFSGADMVGKSGHIKKLVISATGEIMLQKFEGKIERAYDEATGLNLIK